MFHPDLKEIKFGQLTGFVKKKFGKIPVRIVRLKEDIVKTQGLLFDTLKTQRAFQKIAPIDSDACSIIFTNKLIATYDQIDKNLHIRAAVYGWPSVISLSGIIEGPAKPKEFYIFKQRFINLGTWHLAEPKIKEKFSGRFIDYQDKRLTEVIKGYLAQALFFYILGEPFCRMKSCRLFNSHWQEDLIYSQVKSGRFCRKHEKVLKTIKQGA